MKKIKSSDFGGFVGLIDPKNLRKGIIHLIDCPLATGMTIVDSKLYVNSNKVIKIISRGKIIGEFNNNLFNDLHSILSLDKSILRVASSHASDYATLIGATY